MKLAANRREDLWIAAFVHRISGVLLACFLPLHFLALGLALEGELRLNGFLTWAEDPWVKLAETGLLFLLAVHLLGGLRLLAMDVLPWSDRQKPMAFWAAGFAVLCAVAFLLGQL
jgi:fumarate reductase subunit D